MKDEICTWKNVFAARLRFGTRTCTIPEGPEKNHENILLSFAYAVLIPIFHETYEDLRLYNKGAWTYYVRQGGGWRVFSKSYAKY